MISTRVARWSARFLIFACAFPVLFLFGLLFGLIGYQLFANTLEQFLLALACSVLVVYIFELLVSRTDGEAPTLRALQLLFPHERVHGPKRARPQDIDVLGHLVHDGVLAATVLYILLAVAGFLNARAADSPRLWLFLAIICVVLIPVLWVYRYERLRRLRVVKAALFGTEG